MPTIYKDRESLTSSRRSVPSPRSRPLHSIKQVAIKQVHPRLDPKKQKGERKDRSNPRTRTHRSPRGARCTCKRRKHYVLRTKGGEQWQRLSTGGRGWRRAYLSMPPSPARLGSARTGASSWADPSLSSQPRAWCGPSRRRRPAAGVFFFERFLQAVDGTRSVLCGEEDEKLRSF